MLCISRAASAMFGHFGEQADFLVEPLLEQVEGEGCGHRRAALQTSAIATAACGRSRPSPRPPSDCRAAPRPSRRARRRDTGRRRGYSRARRPRCARPSCSFSISSRPGTCSGILDSWLGPYIASKASAATGTSAGCATQVPSWPLPTSRSLSARTFSKAARFCGLVALDRDEGRHAAHREGAAPVTGRDQPQRVGSEERFIHGHQRAVGRQPVGRAAEALDGSRRCSPSGRS